MLLSDTSQKAFFINKRQHETLKKMNAGLRHREQQIGVPGWSNKCCACEHSQLAYVVLYLSSAPCADSMHCSGITCA